MVTQIINLILTLIPKEKAKQLIDSIFDGLEESIIKSETGLDDAIILPLIRKARELLDVPDNDNIG